MMSSFSIASDLALSDLLDEWIMSLCHIFLVAAIVAPLLVVSGLRVGTVDSVRADILDDPDNLRIVPSANSNFEPSWFATWEDDPDIAFLSPEIHFLSASQDVISESEEGGLSSRTLRFLATGPNDPLKPETVAPPDPASVLLTQSAAEGLGVEPGDQVTIVMQREVDLTTQYRDVVLLVTGIVPRDTWSIDGGLLHRDTLTSVWLWGLAADDPNRTTNLTYPNFRLYAASLEQLEPLAERLNRSGVAVRANFAQARRIQLIDRGLGTVFFAIAVVSILGLTAALTTTLWANVARKRAIIATIHASGLPAWACALFPMLQAGMLAFAGYAVAVAIFQIASELLNYHFAALTGIDQPSRLDTVHILIQFAWLLAISLLSSVFAARSLLMIDPAKGMQSG